MTQNKVLEIKVNEAELKKVYLEEIKENLKKLNTELVLWDTKELEKRTCMCMNTIQKEFFYHPDFPKRKVGNKWYYPAEKTRDFILNWIEENG
ncbi:group-specific protein [Peribacillus kribbensis]|uniref:group-specific protein n=1 Tax=Peribacillus kribbensis TaxID=356658 RepID=UPI00054CF895|nr:group-specific protein [Peribacillus kribbensis]